MYQVAMRYENDTLDKVRTAMKTIYMVQGSRASDARDKLNFMARLSANLDLLNVDDVELIREKIVERISADATPNNSLDKKE